MLLECELNVPVSPLSPCIPALLDTMHFVKSQNLVLRIFYSMLFPCSLNPNKQPLHNTEHSHHPDTPTTHLLENQSFSTPPIHFDMPRYFHIDTPALSGLHAAYVLILDKLFSLNFARANNRPRSRPPHEPPSIDSIATRCEE